MVDAVLPDPRATAIVGPRRAFAVAESPIAFRGRIVYPGRSGQANGILFRKERVMRGRTWRLAAPVFAAALLSLGVLPRAADGACCYFSAKDKDVHDALLSKQNTVGLSASPR